MSWRDRAVPVESGGQGGSSWRSRAQPIEQASPSDRTSILPRRSLWEDLKIPAQKSREGLGMITEMVPKPEPTGNMFKDVAMGTPRVLAETMRDVAPEFVSRSALIIGGIGKGLSGAAKSPMVRKAAAGAGRLAAKGIEKVIGIPAQSTERVFTQPTALFSAPTKKTVSAAYAKSEFPQMEQTFEQALEAGTKETAGFVKRGANALRYFIEKGINRPREILEGRKALDKQIAALDIQIDAAKGGSRSVLIQAKNAKLNLRGMFNRALDQMAPKLREADRLASEQLAVDPFRRMTLPGKINFLSPEGLARAVPGLPSVVGTAISGAGAAAKGVGAGMRNIGRVAYPGAASVKPLFRKPDER